MKRTDQILAMARIDPRLTTDRRVDLREKSGRDLHEVEAAPYAKRPQSRQDLRSHLHRAQRQDRSSQGARR